MHLCRKASGRTCRVLTATLLCAFAVAGICVQAGAEKAGKPRKENRRFDTHEIEAMEEQWRQAVMKGDASAIDKMTTDDFLSITSNGTLSDKPQYLHRISSHVNQFSTFDLMVLKIRVQPGSAIATSQTHVTGTLDGRPVDGIFRYTKVYTRSSGGAWRVANFEATRVSRPQAGDSGMERGVPLNAATSGAPPRTP